ncbi:signal peptidase complex-like protein DTM1 [Chenopodium quinoa]|uniref:signal peptidase complex-like protein DTM1 n=1 Tax=Chenopodium quinoa TaxID=63459 RepID=UPI000B7737B0|nr:signal peptidase complex-like protein DTM1 [Chenopodium quinoa]
MADDAALRRCLMWLAVVVMVVGFYTHSFKKMMVTYFMGLGGIAGILLPDWEFFDREISKWTQPVCVDDINRSDVLRPGSSRFRFYPVRTVIYVVVYSFGLYKWWTFVRQ